MNLHQFKIKHGLSLSELSNLFGNKITPSHLSYVCSGKKWIGPETMIEIDRATKGEVSIIDMAKLYMRKVNK